MLQDVGVVHARDDYLEGIDLHLCLPHCLAADRTHFSGPGGGLVQGAVFLGCCV